jgi:hypothetical protein
MRMLRPLGLAAVSLGFWSATSFARPGEGVPAQPATGIRIPVHVTSVPEDRMAARLASAVIKELKSDPRFMSADRESPRAVNILLPARLGWQRRLDWTEVSYQARFNSANGHSRVITGNCWNWNLKACAKQIAGAAAQFGSN